MKCPKCKTGEMWQHGFDSCNWSCELCGYKEYRARPRVKIPSSNSRMDEIDRKMQSSIQTHQQNLREMNRAADAFVNVSRNKRAAQKAAKNTRKSGKEEKSSGLGTIIGIVFVLWLLSKLL